MLLSVQILNQHKRNTGGIAYPEDGLLDPASIESVLPAEARGYAPGKVLAVRTKSGEVLLVVCSLDKMRADVALSLHLSGG
jgi:hypothetical protein